MVRWSRKLIGLVLVTSTSASCTGLSQQFHATYGGINIEYRVQKGRLKFPDAKVHVTVVDDRVDKEILGQGARSSFGSRVLGYLGFGLVYATVPGEPDFRGRMDMVEMFQKAFEERLRVNGVAIVPERGKADLELEVSVRHFRLDFHFSKWLGEVGLVARLRDKSAILCEETIHETARKFNVWGYGSGEGAISEAFNKAINEVSFVRCFNS